jgi:hypothetical protein
MCGSFSFTAARIAADVFAWRVMRISIDSDIPTDSVRAGWIVATCAADCALRDATPAVIPACRARHGRAHGGILRDGQAVRGKCALLPRMKYTQGGIPPRARLSITFLVEMTVRVAPLIE